MGWSCSRFVSDVLQSWSDVCYAQTGLSNVWEQAGTRYMYEVSSKEHRDGRATGSILRFIDDTHAVKAGTFTISPLGMVRGPSFLKNAGKGFLSDRLNK